MSSIEQPSLYDLLLPVGTDAETGYEIVVRVTGENAELDALPPHSSPLGKAALTLLSPDDSAA